MAIQNYNILAKSRQAGAVTPPPALPPLDLSILDAYLDAAHQGPPSDPTYIGHGPQTIHEWEQYRDFGTSPNKNGIYYYDFAQQSMTAYYYFQMRGRSPGPDIDRWLSYADAWGNSMHKDLTVTGTTAHDAFSGGLWMLYDAGRMDLATFNAAINGYINNVNSGFQPTGTNNSEKNARPGSRLADFLMDYWRVNGRNNESYSSVNAIWNQWGGRFHNVLAGGQERLTGHIDEWLDEYLTPSYPENAPYSDPIDYAVRAIDPSAVNACAIFNLGGFMEVFNTEANIRVFHEDANYQQVERRQRILDQIDWHFRDATSPTNTGSWFPPTGTPAAEDQYGAYNLFHATCGVTNGVRVEHQECVQNQASYGSGNTDWGNTSNPTFDLTPWHMAELTWAWRMTSDQKYLERFDRIFEALFTHSMKQPFVFEQNGGKLYNQFLFYLFAALIMRGGRDELGNEIKFKCHWFPDGTFPFNTPAAVDPTDPTGSPPMQPPVLPPSF